DISKTTASIQGFGNVAEYAAKLYTENGGKVIAISCWNMADKKAYTYKKASGCDIEELVSIKDKFGNIDKAKAKAKGYEILDGDAWLNQEVDILIPAALENQITPKNVPSISSKVKIICEGANGPVTPDADPLLVKRGIIVIPDFVCNAGGVTCSYFEQVQCNANYFWSKEEVLSKLESKMTSAFLDVYKLAKEKKLDLRDAAYTIAITRVADAVRLRGWVE
ncbi:MAG: glutamate dehydrogenase, partial [Firmicutes bacterium]|nr:glutamate dehydrogenase [Bacillota bacterium]